jgi:hypothetical protein
MFSSFGLALLVNASLVYRVLGEYQLRPSVLITIFLFICCGAWLKVIALFIEKANGHIPGADHGPGQVSRNSAASEREPDGRP